MSTQILLNAAILDVNIGSSTGARTSHLFFQDSHHPQPIPDRSTGFDIVISLIESEISYETQLSLAASVTPAEVSRINLSFDSGFFHCTTGKSTYK